MMTKADKEWFGDVLFAKAKEIESEPFLQDDPDANRLLNDLDGHAHAFLFGCFMNQQESVDRAWKVPNRLRQGMGGDFSFDALCRLELDGVKHLMSQPKKLHRFWDKMSWVLFSAIKRIKNQYRGDARRIWNDGPSSAELIWRLLEFEGVGPKIASMTGTFLAKDFGIEFTDTSSFDISADVHVKRVFQRLWGETKEPSPERCVFWARALHPEFPGQLDSSVMWIGQKYCKAEKPQCNCGCPLKERCPSAMKEGYAQ